MHIQDHKLSMTSNISHNRKHFENNQIIKSVTCIQFQHTLLLLNFKLMLSVSQNLPKLIAETSILINTPKQSTNIETNPINWSTCAQVSQVQKLCNIYPQSSLYTQSVARYYIILVPHIYHYLHTHK